MKNKRCPICNKILSELPESIEITSCNPFYKEDYKEHISLCGPCYKSFIKWQQNNDSVI